MNRILTRIIPQYSGHFGGKRVLSSSLFTAQNRKCLEDIPGPRSLPVIGTLLDQILYKGRLAKGRIYVPQERVRVYGRIYKESLGANNLTVFLADPNDAEIVLRSDTIYPKRINVTLFEYFWEKYNREPGVFFLNGVKWYKQRSVLSKRMLVPRTLHQFTPEMNNIAAEFASRLKTLRVAEASERINEVENIDHELFKWSFESVTFAIFGKRFGSIGADVDPKIDEFITATGMMLGNIVPTLYIPPKILDYYHPKSYKKFASSYERMYQLAQLFIYQELERNKDEEPSLQNVSEVSLLKYLLFTAKFNPKDTLSSIIDLMFGGVDTTSNTMQWILYELAKNPDKQATLFNEIKVVLPSHGKVSDADLQNMPFLKAVVKETLRLHPVFNETIRTLPEDLVISGYKLPAGTTVMILNYVMGRDPDLFNKPEQFLPERWLKSSKDNTFHKFGSLPFGFGRRMCLGRRLAELELHVLLFHLVLNFHFDYPENEVMYPIARGTLIPEKPVRVKFTDRSMMVI